MKFKPVRHLLITVLALALAAFGVTGLASEDKADASELIKSSQRAVGQVVRAAQALPSLDSGKADAKPFWEAMKLVNESLDKAYTGLSLKDETFFTNIAAARAQVFQAEVALDMNGVKSAQLTSGVQTLSGLVSRLDDNYSKEAARLKQGGKLSASERKQLDQLKKQQKELMAKLDMVERNAAKNNKQMQEGIKKIRKESEKIRKSRNNVGGFVSGFMAARMMSSWMWGWHWWWGPWGAWCPGWIEINIIVWDDWIDTYDYDWALTETLVDVDDLGLDLLDLSDADLEIADDYLINGDFSLDDGDLRNITSDLDLGWNDVDSDLGLEIMDQVEGNFDQVPFDQGFEVETFEDYGMDDFGGGFNDFGGMDFGGFDLDW